jgi:hypothetical protein
VHTRDRLLGRPGLAIGVLELIVASPSTGVAVRSRWRRQPYSVRVVSGFLQSL